LTHIGHEYAGIIGDTAEVIIVRFFGMFFLAFQSSQIWGNLISSQILSDDGSGPEDISACGVDFCPSHAKNLSALGSDEKGKLYTLAGVYIGCAAAAAVIVAIFVDPLLRYGEKERTGESSKLSGYQLLTATGRQMIKPYQLLIIPLTIWSGMEQGYFSADYTQAYITCSWGIGNVGYVLICYGVCDAIASISFGPVIRYLGRVPIFIFGALINVAMIITMFYWKPDPSTPVIFFVIAGFWGIADAIWQTQINALYGVIFPHNEEAAFSNYRLWESVGFIIAYVTGNNACINAKLISLLGVVTIGMAGYLIVEFLERRKKKDEKEHK
jgi:predicted MFS family arabinose efflux permease